MKYASHRSVAALILALCAGGASPAVAHHSHASIDRDDVRVYSGIVTRYGWTAPHVFLKVQVPGPEGELQQYAIEMVNPSGLVLLGWSKDTFRPGDRITWEGAHDRDKSRHYTSLNWAELADGTRLPGSDAFASASEGAEVTPSTDFTGIWMRDDVGGFNPHYLPPADWPYTDLARERVASFSEADNPALQCDDPGPPKFSILPYAHRISRPSAEVIVIEQELNPTSRVVHLGESPPEPEGRSENGYSRGWFEDGSLWVETTDFAADRWGSQTGVDSSDQKRLLERYWLSDDGLWLHAEMQLTDPVYLTETVSIEHRWRKLPDRELVQAPCTLESARLFREAGH